MELVAHVCFSIRCRRVLMLALAGGSLDLEMASAAPLSLLLLSACWLRSHARCTPSLLHWAVTTCLWTHSSNVLLALPSVLSTATVWRMLLSTGCTC